MAVAARERPVDALAPPTPAGWSGRGRPDGLALAARRHLRSLRGSPAQQARQSIEYDRLFGGEGALSAYLRELAAWSRQSEASILARSDDLVARLQGLDADSPSSALAPGALARDPDPAALLEGLAALAPIGARRGVRPLARTRVRVAAATRQAKDALSAHADIIDAWSESAGELALIGEARLDALRRLGRLEPVLRSLCARAQEGDDRARELAVLTRLVRCSGEGRLDALDRVRRAVLSVDPWAAESAGQALDQAAGGQEIPGRVPAATARRYARWLAEHPQDVLGEAILRRRFGLDDVTREDPEATCLALGLTPASYQRRLRRAWDRLDLAA